MKKNILQKVLFLMLISLVSLEANELFLLNLKEKIDSDLSKNLNLKYDVYKNIIQLNKKISIDTLHFSSLMKSKNFLFKKLEKKDLKNYEYQKNLLGIISQNKLGLNNSYKKEVKKFIDLF